MQPKQNNSASTAPNSVNWTFPTFMADTSASVSAGYVPITGIHHGGVKVHSSNNDYVNDPFAQANANSRPAPTLIQRTPRDMAAPARGSAAPTMDLNLDNYSELDLRNLLQLPTTGLISTADMKRSYREVVLKMHPDKSKQDEKYYLFFRAAFSRMQSIVDYMNKADADQHRRDLTANMGRGGDDNDPEVMNPEQMAMLKRAFGANGGKIDNDWFNKQFEQCKIEEENERGYDDWFKSDQDIHYISAIGTNIMSDTNRTAIDQRKRELKSVISYTGQVDAWSSAPLSGAYSLTEAVGPANYTSAMTIIGNGIGGASGAGGGLDYMDLKQAYTETLMPITEEDMNNAQIGRTLDEYKRARDTQNISALSAEETRRIQDADRLRDEQTNAALAFHYAKQAEEVAKKQETFMGAIRRLTNW